jgi:hypothetical protein
VTGDVTWIDHHYGETKWAKSPMEKSTVSEIEKSAHIKFLGQTHANLFYDIIGIIHYEFVPQ